MPNPANARQHRTDCDGSNCDKSCPRPATARKYKTNREVFTMPRYARHTNECTEANDRSAREVCICSTTAQHTPGPCACYTRLGKSATGTRIFYCPTHAAAPRMVEVLRGLISVMTYRFDDACANARAILHDVEG